MRLIDADKLKQHYKWWNNEEQRLFDQIVDAQPMLLPMPPEPGHWVEDEYGFVRCSQCGEVMTMGCDTYSVLVDNVCVAQGVPIDYALIFLKAIMQEYYNDPDISVTIIREVRDDTLGGDHDETD